MFHKLKLMSIQQSDGTETLGMLTPQGVLDIRKANSVLKHETPVTMEALLQSQSSDSLHQLYDSALQSLHTKELFFSEQTLKHGRLFTHPGKIICVGLNYRAHAAETKATPPSVPILFSKFNNALAGHNCVVTLPPKEVSYKIDYETELLIVMGRTARHVTESAALNYVAGYCTAQDLSARDLQTELPAGQWLAGKTLDHFGPIGPYFVSADLVGDPSHLKIETLVNGIKRQSSHTGDMIFSPAQIIAYISKLWPLEPGDIIFTGTPQGVILGLPPEQRVWLKPGDQIVSSIEKLGDLHITLA
jgi:2-keto-4-pentenoate hydratase/2-oxohepta-3-ene-1,7-dioic acid hydratase in catechol pathway